MKTRLRGFTSLLLSLAFLVLILSGIALYVSPKGRVAFWTDWTLIGLDKEDWEAIHTNFSVLVLIVAGFHLYFNWGPFVRYIKTKARWTINMKKELAATALLVAFVFLGSLYLLPPFGTLVELHEKSQNFWEERSPKAPMPHAEEFSLNQLAETIGLQPEEMVESLKKEGLTPESRFVTVRELGKKYGLAPSEVYAAIVKHHPKLKKKKRRQKGTCSRFKSKPQSTNTAHKKEAR